MAMTPEDRIAQLDGEVRAAIYAGADCIASLSVEVARAAGRDLAEVAKYLRIDAGRATLAGKAVRSDMLEMAADMVEGLVHEPRK